MSFLFAPGENRRQSRLYLVHPDYRPTDEHAKRAAHQVGPAASELCAVELRRMMDW